MHVQYMYHVFHCVCFHDNVEWDGLIFFLCVTGVHTHGSSGHHHLLQSPGRARAVSCGIWLLQFAEILSPKQSRYAPPGVDICFASGHFAHGLFGQCPCHSNTAVAKYLRF